MNEIKSHNNPKKVHNSKPLILFYLGILLIIWILLKIFPIEENTGYYLFLSIYGSASLVSAIWVFLDAKKLNVEKHEATFFGNSPITYAGIVFVWWIFAFPFWLIQRRVIEEKNKQDQNKH